jgi:hypothetical protein
MPERLSVCVSGKGQTYEETSAAHVLPSVETHAVLSRVLIYGHLKKCSVLRMDNLHAPVHIDMYNGLKMKNYSF